MALHVIVVYHPKASRSAKARLLSDAASLERVALFEDYYYDDDDVHDCY